MARRLTSSRRRSVPPDKPEIQNLGIQNLGIQNPGIQARRAGTTVGGMPRPRTGAFGFDRLKAALQFRAATPHFVA